MTRAVDSSGHNGSPRLSVPYTVAASAYTAPRRRTCIFHASVVAPDSSANGAAHVRSRETVCSAPTGSASASPPISASKSMPASPACSSNHSSMEVVPSLSSCGTSIRFASPTMTCRRRYRAVLCDSSRVLMIGRSKVVCSPTRIWM